MLTSLQPSGRRGLLTIALCALAACADLQGGGPAVSHMPATPATAATPEIPDTPATPVTPATSAPVPGAPPSAADARCPAGERAAVHESLFFGTAKPKGVVSQREWARFLEQVVTPRFPDGLSVSQASGQWRGADGAIVREATYVLHLVHAADVASERSIGELISIYKTQFRQEAVMRVKSSACISF